MAAKALTRELGAAPLSATIASFIDTEFEFARASFEHGRARGSQDVIAEAAAFYRATVERLARDAV